ncbi:uncharacterized protein ACLA_037770 [Aspergillus clavatus NRRL 1]|uniref:Pentatricopeptide repeat protein n=1 Tax=Aspergillus clavatus (strain ATCC 1007 / CBS 513.65 / DSM 816 / NCTC 3887 / NRRL 1 / QM 1276 / 107) TaxID=344612 RepID=A1CK93_ASPCL|nr:uncharacterized protein ACLA_037770 [Aspergillus clavatus NRRL 1]EAW09567.1 conserved hypothetical protein [Aspergillus clavatus NRRL 1]
MFSRGHPCLRRRGLSAAVLDTVAAGPEEPLLFLYPRWFTSVLRQQRSVASVSFSTARKNPSKSARLPLRGSCPRSRRRWSFGSSARRWVSTETGSAARAGESLERKNVDRARGVERFAQMDGKAGAEARRTDTAVEETAPAADHEESPQPSNLADNGSSHTPGMDRRFVNVNIFPDVQGTAPTMQANSNGSAQGNALGVMESLSVRDRKKLRYRLYLSRMGKDQGTQDKWGRWTKVGDLLEKMQQDTPVWVKKGAVQKELLIPEETVALMAGITDMAMKENVWYVPVRNGCRVHVLHPHESDGQYRKVILSGSKRSVELLGDRIMRARHLQENGDPLVDIRKPPVPVYPSIEAMRRKSLPVPLVRGVWDFYQAFKQPAPLESLLASSGKLSTIREFAEHIEELTRSRSHSRFGRGQSEVAHRERVATALVALFRDDTYRDLFSTAALNRALSYLFDHDVLDDARAIFVRAEHVATVDTFNILLKSAAKRQDIQVFRGFLHSMSRLQIRPNAYTWLAFLDCLVSSKAKASLVKFMLQKGYLSDTSAMRTALQLTIQDSFLVHLQSGQSVDAFFNMIIDTYGANWFPPSLINQMFSVAVRLKDYSSLDRLFEICQKQGFALDSATVNQILPLFRSDIQSALLYMFRCLDRPETQLDRYTWERLFLIAFKGRNYNICRVLWRYACTRRMVTYKMKQSVLTSLVRNVPRNKGDQIDDVWQTTAGNIIVGLDLDQASYPLSEAILDNLPDEYLDSPVAFLASGYKPAGEDREKQLRVASALVQRDIEIGPRYQPSEPFAIMLEAAAVMDRGWKGIPRPWPWLMQNAIQVPVRKADFLSTNI